MLLIDDVVLTSFVRTIVRRPAPETFHGHVDQPANRLGERKLALRDCVGAFGFCLHLNWNISVLQAHIFWSRVDGPPVRRSIRVLDLLSARPAAADVGQNPGSSTRTACSTPACHRGRPCEA
jgi:hypothetical protein